MEAHERLGRVLPCRQYEAVERADVPPPPRPQTVEGRIIAAAGHGPFTVADIVERTGMDLRQMQLACAKLCMKGLTRRINPMARNAAVYEVVR